MRPAREVALDVLHEIAGGSAQVSRDFVNAMATDKSPGGETTRRLVEAIEKAVVADRRARFAVVSDESIDR